MKLKLSLICFMFGLTLFLGSAFACEDLSGNYVTNRGSSEDGGTIITKVVIAQDACSSIQWTFNYPEGNQQIKKIIIDGKERLSYDDGYVVLWESAHFKEHKLIIESRMLQRSESIITKTRTLLFKESRGGHVVENKRIMDVDGGRIGDVITAFIKR
jgi:hypothetical protein